MTVSDDVRRYLRELGATDEEIDDAARTRGLPGLASDLVLRRGASLSPAALATERRLATADVVHLFRLLGINVEPDAAVLDARDAALVRMLLDPQLPGDVLANTDDVLRIIATSLARIADSIVSMYVQQVETPLAATSEDAVRSLEWVQLNTASTELALDVGEALGSLFRHHMQAAVARQRVTQEGLSQRALARVAVGFVDLVGFTPLSRSLPTVELLALVRRFETVAFDIAADRGGRVMKFIGDEVMFSALDADDGARIALDLVGAFGDEVQPRGALCFGEVLTVHGDYYGPVVNLASRLTDGAVPGEVLVDQATEAALSAVATEPGGRRMLKGFDEPVTVFSLRPE